MNLCFLTNAIPTITTHVFIFIVVDMMPTLKTCQVTHELYFRHVDPKSIVKSHRENLPSLHGMEEAGLPLIRSIGYVLNAVHQQSFT